MIHLKKDFMGRVEIVKGPRVRRYQGNSLSGVGQAKQSFVNDEVDAIIGLAKNLAGPTNQWTPTKLSYFTNYVNKKPNFAALALIRLAGGEPPAKL